MDEDDLRSVLAVLADRAPDPRHAAAQADRRVLQVRSTRRRVGLVGVAAAVMVVAGASGIIVQTSRPTTPTPPAAAGSTAASRASATSTGTVTRTEPSALPLTGYDWTTLGGGPELPVTVAIPDGYTVRQMKFYPDLDYSTIEYSAPGDKLPRLNITVGKPDAFVDSPNGADSSTRSRPAPPTTQRRTVTTTTGTALFVDITSSSAALARSLAGSTTVAPTPIDLGIHLSQIPAGDYIAGASTDPHNTLALATVEIAGPSDQGGRSTTLTLRDASGLASQVGSVQVGAVGGRTVTVHIGSDTTSWILLSDGRAIVLGGYPLSGMMLRDALAFPQSTMLPLLAAATTSS